MKNPKPHFTCACLVWLLAATGLAISTRSLPAQQETQQTKPSSPDPQSQREEHLQKTLSNCTFVGRWSGVNQEGLGPVYEEKYTLQGISKVGGNVWLIHARIQYGNKDVAIPVPVKISWIDGTPVIHITDLSLPGLGTYSARVVIQDNMYAGTWSGGKHGGVMSGVIEQNKPAPADSAGSPAPSQAKPDKPAP